MAVSINDVPDKLFLSDYGGNYSTYIDAVYSVFGKHPTPILAVWTISATFAPC